MEMQGLELKLHWLHSKSTCGDDISIGFWRLSRSLPDKEGLTHLAKLLVFARAKDVKVLCITALIAWGLLTGDDVRGMVLGSDWPWPDVLRSIGYRLCHVLKRVLHKGIIWQLFWRRMTNSFSLEVPETLDNWYLSSNCWGWNYYTEVSVNELELCFHVNRSWKHN